ncbi:MAG: methyltransferase domain-containing protein [Pseudonocardiaceae bacterium]
MSGYLLQLSDLEVQRYRRMAEGAAAVERELWQTAGITEAATIADIGCGPGAMSVRLAGEVGREGRVWAVDADPQALTLAAALAAEAGVANVETVLGAADATGLPPASVDVAMLRHVLAHNGGREQAIVDHLAGLVRPGGCVYLVDIDYTATRIRPVDDDVADLHDRYRELHRRRGNDLSVGLRLAELLRAAGLDIVDFSGRYKILELPPGVRGPAWAAREALAQTGLAEPADIERWAAAFERADGRAARPTLFAAGFIGIGRAPA